MFFLMKVYGNTSAIIDNRNGVVFVDSHLDMGAESRESLIDRVVDNLIDKVVETFLTDVADIHCRAFSDSLEAFEHLNGTRAVFFVSFFSF